jgi:hypothetical protein
MLSTPIASARFQAARSSAIEACCGFIWTPTFTFGTFGLPFQ